MSRLGKTASALAFVVLLAGIGYASIVYMYTRDATKYAPNFSEEKFTQIRLGMGIDEAHGILGVPLQKEIVEPYDIWHYTEDPKPISKDGEVYFPLARADRIWFDESGHVVEGKGERTADIRPGMSKDQVLGELGNPVRRELSRTVLLEYYTLPPELGRYEERAVGYDKAGKVSELRKRSIHYD